MNDSLLQTLANIPFAHQAAYLASCVQHGIVVAERVGSIPTEETRHFFSRFHAWVWNGVSTGSFLLDERQALLSDGPALQDELEQEMHENFVHLTGAALVVIKDAGAAQTRAKNCLNLVAEYVALSDPEGEEGLAEEEDWQQALLASFHAKQASADFSLSLFDPKELSLPTDWEARWRADWEL